MMVSMGEDKLLAGSVDGKAAYSVDGNTSWSKLVDGIDGNVVQIVAEGLEEGDLMWAATSTPGDDLYRWDWADDEWDDEGDTDATHGAYGIALHEGVLYVVTANSTDSKTYRTINPTADDPSWNEIDEATDTYNATPSALRLSSSEGITKLWALDTTLPALASYKDTLALSGPTLIVPKLGFVVPMNPVTGEPLMVTFSWERPSTNVDGYDLQIAYDDAFNEVVTSYEISDDSSTVTQVADVAWNYDTTYYWRVRTDLVTEDSTVYGPIRSPWSEVRSFRIEALPVTPPVEVAPTPEITVEVPPAPSITLPAPEITLPAPPPAPPEIVIPPAPAPPAPITPAYIWAIIIIGAILVIAVIVLIVRTRRPV
jgi:hypothetical protein